MSLFLMRGLNLFDVPWVTCTWQAFRVVCLLLDPMRFISYHLFVNVGYIFLEIDFHCSRTFMSNKCYISKEILLRFSFDS